jgi:hypothetical protein
MGFGLIIVTDVLNFNPSCSCTMTQTKQSLARRSGQNCLLHMPSPTLIYAGWETEDLYANPITSNF